MEAYYTYYGKRIELIIYLIINGVMPLISSLFSELGVSFKFYLALALFILILILNTLRALIGGRLRLIYGATIVANVLSFLLLSMLSYIFAIPIIPYLI